MSLGRNNSLGEWAAVYSGASKVFIKNRLDFCCGGKMKLEDACRKNDLDVDEIISDIRNSSKDSDSLLWDKMPLGTLVDEILEKFHKKHREDLEYLIPLAKKVESVHSDKPECPTGLSDFLMKLQFELESHMQKEERILFPMIKSGQGSMAQGPISVMTHEHVSHGENLTRLRKLVKDFELPGDACGSWVTLYQGISTLEREIMEHIATENNILFSKSLSGL